MPANQNVQNGSNNGNGNNGNGASGNNSANSHGRKHPVVAVNNQHVTVSTTEGATLRQSQIAAAGNPLDGLTLPQALNWIDNTVSDVASARTALKQVIKVVFVLQAALDREKGC